jgi:diguanylate cyclase (GGDEF)-like protein/PAS domain S-box-containing protein
MKLKAKVWLSLGFVTIVVMCLDLYRSYQVSEQQIIREAEHNARNIYGYMMATRRIYQQQFIDSGLPLNDKTVGFLPAHSLSLISKDYKNWNESGIIFNNVTDRPRNPGNQADKFELEDMRFFLENPNKTSRLRNISDNKTAYTLYTSPIWIEPFCLKCHDTPENAPEGIKTIYPEQAYGYKVGDLRGLVSIKIPTEELEAERDELWLEQLFSRLLGYIVLFFALGFIIEKLVIKKVQNLQHGVNQMASGDYDANVSVQGADEISNLSDAFNAMVAQIKLDNLDLRELSTAVNQSPVSIFITDDQANILYVNDYFLEHSGYQRQEVIGKTPSFLQSGKTLPEVYQSLWKSMAKGDRWIGELINKRKDGSIYTDLTQVSPIRDEQGNIIRYLAIQEDISEKQANEHKIYELINFDKLTGLASRTLLFDRLEQALIASREEKHYMALLLIDIDRFKNINNALGQAFGDKVIIEVALRLQSCLEGRETLARIGGDEYALLISGLSDHIQSATRDIVVLSEKICAALKPDFKIDDETIAVNISMGVSLFTHNQSIMPINILKQAETALHHAKNEGGKQMRFFQKDMGHQARQRFLIERELVKAIENNELSLYLQPQFTYHQDVVGAEVLLRWQHPEHGFMAPDEFIPIAEESDLISELDRWVITNAFELIKHYTLPDGRRLQLSINLSPRLFKDESFLPWLEDLLSKTKVDPALVTLEVTERLMMDNLEDIVLKMEALVKLGFQFSIDDFGTGYSSLAYLKQLPIHEIKIDKSFVQFAPSNPDDAALVDTILGVANNLKMDIVAEGVETNDQANFLHERAEIIYQGYLYGKPKAALEWLDVWQASQ